MAIRIDAAIVTSSTFTPEKNPDNRVKGLGSWLRSIPTAIASSFGSKNVQQVIDPQEVNNRVTQAAQVSIPSPTATPPLSDSSSSSSSSRTPSPINAAVSASPNVSGVREKLFLSKIADLREGDILTFVKPYEENGIVVNGIKVRNSMSTQTHGHNNTTHVAVCTGPGPDGRPLIAHLTGHGIMGFVEEPLEDMMKRDGGDRAFHAFRPKDSKLASHIAVRARDPHNESIRWHIPKAVVSLGKVGGLNSNRAQRTEEKPLSQNSFCSKFAIEVIKGAEVRTHVDDASKLNIRSDSSPADLEGALHDIDLYQPMTYPGSNIYTRTMGCINEQLQRIEKKNPEKFKKCIDAIQKIWESDNFLELNEYAQVKKMLKALLPILNETKLGIADVTIGSKSYRTVLAFAKSNGIFLEDIQNG
jgi:hypothetical protein